MLESHNGSHQVAKGNASWIPIIGQYLLEETDLLGKREDILHKHISQSLKQIEIQD